MQRAERKNWITAVFLQIPKSQTHTQQMTERLSRAGWEGGTEEEEEKEEGGGGEKGLTESALLKDRKADRVTANVGRSPDKQCRKTGRRQGVRNREGDSHVRGEKRSRAGGECLGNRSLWWPGRGQPSLKRCCEETCQVIELEAASRRAQLVRYSNMAIIMIYVSCNSGYSVFKLFHIVTERYLSLFQFCFKNALIFMSLLSSK